MAKKQSSESKNNIAQISDLKKNLGKSKVLSESKKDFFKLLAEDQVSEETIKKIHKAIEDSIKSESSDKEPVKKEPVKKEPVKKEPSSTESVDVEPESEFEKLVKSKDFKKFIKIQEVIGEIEEDMEFTDLTDGEIRQITSDYHGWVNAGKPKPQLTKAAKGKIEKIISVTRRKHFGKQFLTYVTEGADVPSGIKYEVTYAKIPQADGSVIEDTDNIIKNEPRYTIPYKAETAKKLMQRCNNESIKPKFYFVIGGKTYTVQNHENFTGNFDELIVKAQRKEII